MDIAGIQQMFVNASTTMFPEHLSQAGTDREPDLKLRAVSFYSFYEMKIFTRIMYEPI